MSGVSCLVIRDLFALPHDVTRMTEDGIAHDTLFLMSRDRFPGPVLTHFNTRSAGKYEDNMTHPDPATSSAQHHHVTVCHM